MFSVYLTLLENPEDESRFIEFYNKFYDTVYFIAKDHLGTHEAAEDCAQEIMFHFARDFHNINQSFDDNSFKAYVSVVAKGISVDMYRREKKHRDQVVDADISEFIDLSVDEFDLCDEMLLKQAINEMPESYKYIFYLKHYFGFSGAEIAQKLGLKETTVRQKCFLGMKFARKFIEEAERNE